MNNAERDARAALFARIEAEVLSAAENMGFKNLFMQDFDSSDEKFIPDFDFTGI